MVPENALAYEKNQATSQTSDCGNEFIPISNIGCQNTDSQIQGDENTVALTAQQTFPEVRLVQEKPTPKPTPISATLQVCKDAVSEIDGDFDITGNDPSPDELSLVPGDCRDVTIGPGDYEITEVGLQAEVSGDCTQGPAPNQASGSIEAGETQICSFLNIEEEPVPQTCEDCLSPLIGHEDRPALLLADSLGLGSSEGSTDEQIIADMCEALLSGEIPVEDIEGALVADPDLLASVSEELRGQIISCLGMLF
jgi:hypothetical protein